RLRLSIIVVDHQTAAQPAEGRDGCSADRSLYERLDHCLFRAAQFLQREGRRPHLAFVEFRLVAETERGVASLEFLRALKETDDLPVLGISRHPIPGFWG